MQTFRPPLIVLPFKLARDGTVEQEFPKISNSQVPGAGTLIID